MTRADRKYLAFAITALIMLGLVGLGAYLYKPLKLRYAIYKVRGTDYRAKYEWTEAPIGDDWLMLCLDAACEGNRQAMEVVVERAGVKFLTGWPPTSSTDPTLYDVSYCAAVARPELFFEVLDRHNDRQAIKVLQVVADSAYCGSGTRLSVQGLTVLEGLIQEFEMHAKSNKPEVRLVAASALAYARRRFAKELAEAEAEGKKKEAAP